MKEINFWYQFLHLDVEDVEMIGNINKCDNDVFSWKLGSNYETKAIYIYVASLGWLFNIMDVKRKKLWAKSYISHAKKNPSVFGRLVILMNIHSKNKRRFYAYDFNKFNTNKIIF
jgi:hypothetical protein